MLIATGVMTCASMAPAMAGNPAPDDKNVTIGKGAVSSPYLGQTGNVAIGENAKAWNGNGRQEGYLDFGQAGAKVSFLSGATFKDGTKLPGSIAIGKNTVARSGSTMIGDHGYNGAIGDTTITPDGNGIMKYNNDVYSTTIGANSFNSGALASVTGVFSIASSQFDGSGWPNTRYASQNTGATIYGSMNSIESATSNSSYSGVASSVLGFANRTQNANAALIWGTGNEITNSIEKIGIEAEWTNVSVADAQKEAIKAMQSGKYAGGSVLAIGGGNKADYATYSQLTGVQNKVTGTKDKAAKYDFVNGYKNTVANASDVTVIGIENKVTADGNKVIGDNHKVSGKDNVIFGSADKLTETTVNNAVVLGHNAKVTGEGGVALGAGSVADRANAVSVGSSVNGKKITRQITNVAEGTEDTDAVNVSQLKKATANANKGWKLSTEGGAENQVASEATVDFSGKKDAGGYQNITVSNDGNDVKIDLASELHNVTGVVNEGSRVTLGMNTAGINNGTAQMAILSDGIYLSNLKDEKKNVQIHGVANGEADKDAVNYGQLKDVKAEAGKHTTLSDGKNTTVESTVKDGQTDYKVNVAGDLTDITSVANGGAKLALNGAAGVAGIINGKGASVYLQDGYTKINNKVIIDQDGKISGVAAGTADTDAVNLGQLKDVKAEAGKHTTLSDGKNTTVESTVKDGQTDYKVNVAGDLTDITSVANGGAKLALNGAAGVAGIINGKGASVYLQDGYTKINNQVSIDQDGKISGVAAGTADTDAVNVSQLKKVSDTANAGWNLSTNGVATEATNVKPGDNVDFSGDKNISVSNDGTKVKVELNKNIDVNYVQTNALNAKYNMSVGTANADGTMPFFVNSTGAFYAAGNKFSVDKDGNANANSVQTNALNSKYNLSVGTMAENGIMPFFVNSTGAFYAAGNKFSVDKDGKIIAPEAEIKKVVAEEAEINKLTAKEGVVGGVVLNNGVFYKNSALRDGELFIGDNDGNYSQITPKSAKLGKVTIDKDGKISGVAAGAVTADSTDAVNGSQLHAVATEAGKHSKVVGGNNINVEETDVDGQKFYKVNMNKDIILGDLTGKYVNISGTNGTIETTGYIATQDRVYADKGGKLADIDVTGNKISNGASSIVLDGSNVKVNDKVTIDQNGKISGVAAGAVTADSTDAINGSQLHQTNAKVDALGDRVTKNEEAIKNNAEAIKKNEGAIKNNAEAIKKNEGAISDLNTRVDKVEKQHTTVTAGDKNITVTEGTNEDGGKEYKVALSNKISVDSVKAGDTTISDKGLEIKDGPSVTKDGIYAGDKKITGVAKGENDTDAVNYGQLKETNNHIDRVENQVVSNTNRINQLGSRVNKVGAGAAALAALHPMDFDPDDKLTFSAGYGNYAGENAAAIGAYYRPDEKVMFSVGGTVGNGENMVNAGVSFSLDRTNHVSNSRTAMAREILDLRAEVTELKAMVAKGGLGSIAEDKMKIFPDVAENHWAYEYVGKLAAAGIIEGYPDGKFSGDRMMSRYEFAAMLYRAMQKGAQLDSKIINEFAPEMGRIRVDRISGEDGDRDKIERVRVNAVKGERDHYGNKIAKAEAKAK